MNDKTLKPCPFCGHETPEFERLGTSRQSCIVVCGNCGCRHESSDEGNANGDSWNDRILPAASEAAPILYQHSDGRYGLTLTGQPATFTTGDPEWYRVPLDIVEPVQTIRNPLMVASEAGAVPVVPTQGMLEAARLYQHTEYVYDEFQPNKMYAGIWHAMLKAAPPSAPPSAPAAEPLTWTAEALYGAIKKVIRGHHVSNWVGDDGEPFPLVDVLCDKDGKDISSGEAEIVLLCDAIYNDVLTKAAPAAESAEPEHRCVKCSTALLAQLGNGYTCGNCACAESMPAAATADAQGDERAAFEKNAIAAGKHPEGDEKNGFIDRWTEVIKTMPMRDRLPLETAPAAHNYEGVITSIMREVDRFGVNSHVTIRMDIEQRIRATLSRQPSAPASAADVQDAARWRMLPAFFEDYQINGLQLSRDIDATLAAAKPEGGM